MLRTSALKASTGSFAGDFKPITDTSWIGKLKYEDHQLLRKVVRKVHLHYAPLEIATDAHCDKIIEALGPKVAENMIRKAVDGGLR